MSQPPLRKLSRTVKNKQSKYIVIEQKCALVIMISIFSAQNGSHLDSRWSKYILYIEGLEFLGLEVIGLGARVVDDEKPRIRHDDIRIGR